MIAVTNTERTDGSAWCHGCYYASRFKGNRERYYSANMMRLEASPSPLAITRTMYLCRSCRAKMIQELEKTV